MEKENNKGWFEDWDSIRYALRSHRIYLDYIEHELDYLEGLDKAGNFDNPETLALLASYAGERTSLFARNNDIYPIDGFFFDNIVRILLDNYDLKNADMLERVLGS